MMTNIKIYEQCDCVCCFGDNVSVILVPCGHKCLCNECYILVK